MVEPSDRAAGDTPHRTVGQHEQGAVVAGANVCGVPSSGQLGGHPFLDVDERFHHAHVELATLSGACRLDQ